MNRRRLIIIGAGGHGRVMEDVAGLSGYTDIAFLDDKLPVLGKVKDFVRYVTASDFFVAIGDNAVRERIFTELSEHHATIVKLLHPKAVIADGVTIGAGTAVMAGAVINPGVRVGDGVIVNTCSSIDHDCTIEAFTHISVGAHLAGTVHTGRRTFVGMGANIIHQVTICADCVIGAGTAVVKDIDERGTYVGVPAKRID